MSRTLEIKHTSVFDRNWTSFNDPNIRFILNQGGSRSSKTWSLCQMLIVYCLTNKNKVVSVVRKTFPSLRGSVMRDLFSVMKELDIYTTKNHNKTENIYTFDSGSIIEFFSVDDEQKLRGRKRDVLWANEANELNYEQFTQLNMRTTEKLIFDFNPSDNYSWLYDLIGDSNCKLIHSTYKDNPFLEEEIVKQIENLINIDEAYWRIYALGERTTTKTTIYTNWDNEWSNDFQPKEIVYGLDFGFTNPSTLIECAFNDNIVQIREIVYEYGLTSGDLIKRFRDLEIPRTKDILCDSARPEIIEDLKRAGWNGAKPANKSVVDGINSCKMYRLRINPSSINLTKEIQNYKWKSDGDIVMEEPVKLHDHCLDAMRYAIHYWKIKNSKTDKNYFRIKY